MDFIKQHRNQIYIGVTIIASILVLVLCLDFKIRRDAERNEAAMTATTIKEKEKKDKVVISVSTDTIQDGLANMGVLITQEYYFTQVEKYTKDRQRYFQNLFRKGFFVEPAQIGGLQYFAC